MELLLVVIILILLFGGGFSLYRRSGSGHLMRPIPSGSTRSRPECENALRRACDFCCQPRLRSGDGCASALLLRTATPDHRLVATVAICPPAPHQGKLGCGRRLEDCVAERPARIA